MDAEQTTSTCDALSAQVAERLDRNDAAATAVPTMSNIGINYYFCTQTRHNILEYTKMAPAALEVIVA